MVSQLTAPDGPQGVGDELRQRMREMPAYLAANIKGQDHVLPRVSSVLQRGELGTAHPDRPKGSFLFIGPTGTGKTETTKAFGRYLFGTEPVNFDMSEYQLQSSVEKFIGANRDDAGLLGRALRGLSRGVVLFDEIEKAHTLVLDLFLQILWEGRVTLATGEVLNFCPLYVVFTSNIGSGETMRMESAPFASVERTVLMRVHERFRSELVGRISDLIVFRRLDYATQRVICEGMIAAESSRLAALGYVIEVSPPALEFLVRVGFHRMLGARPMRAAVERHLQEAVVDSVLSGGDGSGQLGVETAGQRLVLGA